MAGEVYTRLHTSEDADLCLDPTGVLSVTRPGCEPLTLRPLWRLNERGSDYRHTIGGSGAGSRLRSGFRSFEPGAGFQTVLRGTSRVHPDHSRFIGAKGASARCVRHLRDRGDLELRNRAAFFLSTAVLQEERVTVFKSGAQIMQSRQIGKIADEASILMRRFISSLCAEELSYGADGGSLISGNFRPQQVWDYDRRHDENERNENHAQITENQACDRQSMSLQTTATFANVGKREVAEDDGNHEQWKDIDNPANQACNRFPAGSFGADGRINGRNLRSRGLSVSGLTTAV